MKKLILLFILFPIATFAQVRPGLFKFQLIPGNLKMELTNSNFIRVAEDCRDRTPNCGKQVWQIIAVRGKPNTFQISLQGSGKLLTWNDPTENAIRLELTLQSRYTLPKFKYQQFNFVANDKGSYQIQPAFDDATPNNFFLSATVNPGAHYAVGIFKKGATEFRDVQDAWIFTPPITPLAPQASPSVTVTPPSDNKIDIDIKTGSDNLETRGFQKNPQITVNISNQSPIILEDINKGQNWPNNSIKRVTIPLPNNINLSDLQSITILRDAVNGSRNNIDGAGADNWNIAKLTVTASIKTNGRLVRTVLFNQGGVGSQPLVRIVYEKRNNTNPIEVTSKTFNLSVNLTPVPENTVTTNASISAVFGTGGDDLRGGNDNINMLIRFKSGRLPISLNNLNARRNWRNFAEITINKELPNGETVDINDIKEVIIRHTGGGGIGADNWYLDKFKLTITKGSETKVLIDRVEAPIHYFTGDARSKTLQILP